MYQTCYFSLQKPWLHFQMDDGCVHTQLLIAFIAVKHHIDVYNINGSVQDCGNSIANALELLQSCAKPWIYRLFIDASESHVLRWMCILWLVPVRYTRQLPPSITRRAYLPEGIPQGVFLHPVIQDWYTACSTISGSWCLVANTIAYPYSNIRGANMGSTWVLSAPGGPNVGPMDFAVRVVLSLVWLVYQDIHKGIPKTAMNSG